MDDYRDFWLRIEHRADGLWVRSESTASGSVSAPLVLPEGVDALQLSSLLTTSGTARGGPQRDLVLDDVAPQPADHDAGEALFEALLPGPVRDAFMRTTGSGQAGGVRVRLQIDVADPALADVAGLPWELLYSGRALGLSKHTPIVRSLDVAQPTESVPFAPPLRVLIVLASPSDAAPLDLDRERQQIVGVLESMDGVEVEVIEHATQDALYDRLDEGRFHILHYMGHGAFDENGGALVLEDEQGLAAPLSARLLGDDLAERRSLRLVILNACDTARVGSGVDPFTGAAQALVAAGIPAVVAMQVPVADNAAIAFAEKVYSLLAQGEPIDAAVAVGRRAIYRENPSSLEWATPVLFLRSQDGYLFDAPTPPAEPEHVGWGVRQWALAAALAVALVALGAFFVTRDGDENEPPIEDVAAEIAAPADLRPRDVALALRDDRAQREADGFERVASAIAVLADGEVSEDTLTLDPGFEYVATGVCDGGCSLDLALLGTDGPMQQQTGPTPVLTLPPVSAAVDARLRFSTPGCASETCVAGAILYRRPITPSAAPDPPAPDPPGPELADLATSPPVELIQFALAPRSTFFETTRDGLRYFKAAEGVAPLLVYAVTLLNASDDDVYVTGIVHRRLDDAGEAAGGPGASGPVAPGAVYVQEVRLTCENDDDVYPAPVAVPAAFASPVRIVEGDPFQVEVQPRYRIEGYEGAFLAPLEMQLGLQIRQGGESRVLQTERFWVDGPSCAG